MCAYVRVHVYVCSVCVCVRACLPCPSSVAQKNPKLRRKKKKDLNSAALYHSLPSSSKKAPAARDDDDMDMGGKGKNNCVSGQQVSKKAPAAFNDNDMEMGKGEKIVGRKIYTK